MTNALTNNWIKSTCAYCGVGCGIEAKPLANGLLQVRGDKDHPANYGRLCSKGLALGETVVRTGRLLQPSVNGKATNWQESLDLVANTFLKTIEKYGSDSVAFYVSGQLLTEDYYLANKLMKGFIGSGNIDTNSRLCMSSSVAGHKRAFGSDTVAGCYDDLERAEVVILTGSNLAWCHPVLFQRLKERKQRGDRLKIVVIDPRKTATCEIADIHLAIQPGGDVKLFNGLLSYLAYQGFLDRDYIAQHTQGFNETLIDAQRDAQNSLAIASTLGVEHWQLLAFYKLFATKDRVVTCYSQGVNQSTQGTDKVNSIINCHLATGKIGKPGSCPLSITGQPNAMGGREVGGLANTLASHMEFGNEYHHQLISEYWQTKYLATKPGLKAVELFEAINSGKIKAIWIMATNPVASLPDSKRIQQALDKCPFVVVSDCIADTDTTRMADVLLPAQGWAEKSGTVTNTERRISRQRRLVASPGEARPDWWIIAEVAKRMGFGHAFDYHHEADIFAEYARTTILGNDDNPKRDLDLSGLVNLSASEYVNMPPQQWPVPEKQASLVHQRMFGNGQFFTPSGRAQFVPVTHQPPQQQPDSEFSWQLNSGRNRDQWHTMTRTGLAPKLSNYQAEPSLNIHPDDAKDLDLKTGDIATITSATGCAEMRVEVSQQVKPKHLFAPIHWSDTTSSNGKVCNVISACHFDPNSGQPEYKLTPVKLVKSKYSSQAMLLSPEEINTSAFAYWVKQKVPQGYLYRIASPLSPAQLAALIHENTKQASPQTQLDYQTHDQTDFRSIYITKQQIAAGYIVAEYIDFDLYVWFQSILQQPLNADVCRSIYLGKPSGELAKGKIVCACMQVGQTTLLNAIKTQGITSLAQVTTLTRAGSGCGGCLADIGALLKQQTVQIA